MVNEPRDEEIEPDWLSECEVCGSSPVMPLTGMCGPCIFGEADADRRQLVKILIILSVSFSVFGILFNGICLYLCPGLSQGLGWVCLWVNIFALFTNINTYRMFKKYTKRPL